MLCLPVGTPEVWFISSLATVIPWWLERKVELCIPNSPWLSTNLNETGPGPVPLNQETGGCYCVLTKEILGCNTGSVNSVFRAAFKFGRDRQNRQYHVRMEEKIGSNGYHISPSIVFNTILKDFGSIALSGISGALNKRPNYFCNSMWYSFWTYHVHCQYAMHVT